MQVLCVDCVLLSTLAHVDLVSQVEPGQHVYLSPPVSVTRAITVRGRELAEAVLSGQQDIVDRAQKLDVGWVALHTSVQDIDAEHGAVIQHLCPGVSAAAARISRGAVVGICLVDGALTFEDLRQQQGSQPSAKEQTRN